MQQRSKGGRKDSRPLRLRQEICREQSSLDTLGQTWARRGSRFPPATPLPGAGHIDDMGDLYSMKKIGFLSFGHWAPSPQSRTQSGADALLQSIDLAVEAERLGMDGAYFRVHHFAQQLASPFPLLAAVGAKTRKIEIGTAVIDMRYENPHYMAEDAGAADLISGGRLQLGISRGSPEQVIDGWRYFGYRPMKARTMQAWAAGMPKNFLSCCAERASLSLTRVQCFPILRDFCVLSHTLRDCVIESGGGLLPTRQQYGPRSWE